MKRCPTCNGQFGDDRTYCPNDGNRLVDAPTGPAPTGFGARLSVQLPSGQTSEVPLTGEPLSIGKAPECGLSLADPAVSRNHATIVRQDGQFLVLDAGSRNGVFVNGQRVGPGGQPLRPGDVVTIGQSRLTFQAAPLQAGSSGGMAPPPQPSAPSQPPPPFVTTPPPSRPPTGPTGGRVDVILPTGEHTGAPLAGSELTIGKGPENGLVLADPAVSRRHAALQLINGQWTIFDTGSRNGVFVNGQRIGDGGRVLQPGDAITIGTSRLSLSLEAPSVDLSSPKTVAETPAPGYQQPYGQQPPTAPPPSYQEQPTAPTPPPQQQQQPTFRVGKTGELTPLLAQSLNVSRTPGQGIVLDGRYELESKIGQGQTGTVYRARRVLLNDYVAVKVLRPELVQDANALLRFRRQAQVAARIHHPNSVQVHDFGTTPEGAVYIVEELLSGRTLRDVILKERGLTLARVVGIFNQICGAVHAAHLNGIVLRDIKPESIFVETGPDGKELVKIGGYGLAKVDATMSGGVTMAAQAKVLGTPQYMSPEQWLDQPLDSRSDVYSLGVILYELLTGAVPFDALSSMEIASMHLNSPVPDITDFGRPDLDEGLAAVVNRALAKDRNRRQPTALHLAAELQAVSGAAGGVVGKLFSKATGILPFAPMVVPQGPAAVPAGEVALPSVVAETESKGTGAFPAPVLALMAEAFFSRISSGLIKTAVPLYALLVFGLDITSVMVLSLIQNIVPLLLRSFFGGLADKHGKKKIFMMSLFIRTGVTLLYAIANLPILFGVSVIRGIADSAKGPSASAMIADYTDEKHIATAYSAYTTTKSTSGGIGESIAAFMLVWLIIFFAGLKEVTGHVAVLDEKNKKGQNVEVFLKDPAAEVDADQTIAGDEAHPGRRKVLQVEDRTVQISSVPIDDLPKVVDPGPLKRTLQAIFIASTVFSAFSLILVAIFIKDKKKDKSKEKKVKDESKKAAGGQTPTGMLHLPQKQPNVWAFAFLGTALTAPAYMVTGEFFTVLAVKLEVTPNALGWIKIVAETITPLFFGPFFGWLADRIGAGKVIALRSVANLLTSLLFWITPWFAGTALLGLMMGIARGADEIGKAAFKPTWGAIAAKVSSFNLANRSRTMGIMEGGIDASDLLFPQLAGVLFQYLSLGALMLVRAVLAVLAEIYGHVLMKKYDV